MKRRLIALGAGLFVSGVMCVFLLGFTAAYRRLAAHGAATRGWVVRKDAAQHQTVHYAFRAGERTYSAAGQPGDGNPSFHALQVGDSVLVFYLPENPAVSEMGEHRPWTAVDALGLAATAALMGSIAAAIAFHSAGRTRARPASGADRGRGRTVSGVDGDERMAEIHARLLGLCERALNAALPFNEMIALMPPALEGIPFYEDVYWDLSFGVEHVPSKGFSRQINFEEWYASEMHDVLAMDIRLMRSGLSPVEMSRIRGALAEGPRFSMETVDRLIADTLSRVT